MAQAGAQLGNPLTNPTYGTTAVGSTSSGQGSASGSIGVNVTGATVQVPAVVLDTSPGQPPAPYAMDIDSEFNDANYYVEFGAERASRADGYISALQDLAGSLRPPTVNPQFPTVRDAPTPQNTTAPALAPSVFNEPSRPAAFTDGLAQYTGELYAAFGKDESLPKRNLLILSQLVGP